MNTSSPSCLNDPVKPAPEGDALFTSSDPVLHRNKEAACHIFKILDEAGRWDRAREYKTERYIQHNLFVV